MRPTPEGYEDITFLFGCLAGILVLILVALRLSLWIFPPQKYDDWSSKPINGWSNLQPKKMATYRHIEVESGKVKADDNNKFKGV